MSTGTGHASGDIEPGAGAVGTADTRLRWGRTRPGGPAALPRAVALGALVALLLGAARVAANPPGPYRWVAALILAGCLAGPFIALAWVLLVDRSTLRGAVPRPELSVESSWYRSAVFTAFHLLVGVLGVAAFLGGMGLSHGIANTLAGVLAVAAVLVGACYLVERGR